MCSRLTITLFAVLAAGCIDDTASLSGGPRPAPIPTTARPSEEPPVGAGQGGSAASVEVGGESAGGSPGGAPSGGADTVEPPTQGCEPGPERCNGEDDDCNDGVDEGCPISLAWKTSFARPALGDSPGGAIFSDSCEKDELLVGLKVAVGAWVDQVSGICRKFALKPDTEKSPYEYSLSLLASRELAAHPAATSSEVEDLLCDDHQGLVGLRLSQQNFVGEGQVQSVVIPSLWIVCAEPLLALDGGTVSVSWQDAVEVGPVAGSFANGMAWFAADEPVNPQLAVTLHGAAGGWIDRLGLGTSAIDAALR